MSHYGWERGTIKLPSAEFSRLRQELAAIDLSEKKRLFDASQDFWKSLTAKQRIDSNAHEQAWFAYDKAHTTRRYRGGMWGGTEEVSSLPSDLADLILHNARRGKPARILKEQIEFPTNRTTQFRVGLEAVITFDKSTSSVEWGVSENNHAVQEAHDHYLGRKLFELLKTVKWTRGTGGYLYGNDEYSRDEDNGAGAGAHYETSAFGPLGAEHHPHLTDEFRMSDGKWIRRDDFPANVRDRAEREKAAKKAASKVRAAEAARQRRTAAQQKAAEEQRRIADGTFTFKSQSAPDVTL